MTGLCDRCTTHLITASRHHIARNSRSDESTCVWRGLSRCAPSSASVSSRATTVAVLRSQRVLTRKTRRHPGATRCTATMDPGSMPWRATFAPRIPTQARRVLTEATSERGRRGAGNAGSSQPAPGRAAELSRHNGKGMGRGNKISISGVNRSVPPLCAHQPSTFWLNFFAKAAVLRP